jgi:hypothetical protein
MILRPPHSGRKTLMLCKHDSNFTGATLTELEIRDSDVAALKKVDFVGDISQTKCRDAGAKLLKVQDRVTACVISGRRRTHGRLICFP